MPFVEAFCTLAEQHGHDRRRLLEGTGLTVEQVADSSHLIGEHLLKGVLRRTMDVLGGDPAIGLELGLLLSIRAYGFWGYAALASRTLGEATLGVLLPYHRAFTPVTLALRIEEAVVVIEAQERTHWGELWPVFCDAGVVSFPRVLETLVGGRIQGLEVRLPYPERSHHTRLRAMVHARMQFGCSAIQFRFLASELERPIQLADPTLARLARAQCEQELRHVREETSLLARVRSRVVASIETGAPLDRIAGELHMTPRTLRRRLEALGTSYRAVYEAARAGLAREYLLTSNRSVESIARSLGYDDDSNFRRAFRRWTGLSPADYRAKTKGNGSQ
jgi:AraC-like DNA-binding protein